jgi:hypothetical protein
VALFIGALLLALVEVKGGVFLGDESKAFPVFLIISQAMVVIGILVAAFYPSGVVCANSFTTATSGNSRVCAWVAWWSTFWSIMSLYWLHFSYSICLLLTPLRFMLVSFNLFAHIYQLRVFERVGSLQLMIGIHLFGWSVYVFSSIRKYGLCLTVGANRALILATAGVVVAGAAGGVITCSIDSNYNNGWGFDGFFFCMSFACHHSSLFLPGILPSGFSLRLQSPWGPTAPLLRSCSFYRSRESWYAENT